MEPRKALKRFRYENTVRWDCGRCGCTSAEGKPDVKISSPPEFKGEPGYWTPEDMFVASVNACTLLTFIAYALREELAILGYESSAEGFLENAGGGYQFTEIVLRPRIVVKSEEDAELARTLLETAHMGCLVTRSVKTAVKVLPQLEVAESTL